MSDPTPPLGRGARRNGRRALATALVILAALATPRASTVPARLLVLLFFISALAWAASALVAFLSPRLVSASRLATELLLFAAMVIVPATLLGHVGCLTLTWFSGWVAMAALFAVWAPDWTRPKAANGGSLESWFWPALIALVLSWLLRYWGTSPGALHFDDTYYHLPTVVTWLRYGDLRMLKWPTGDWRISYYPFGGELLSWFLLVPFPKCDVFARWSQLPWAVGCLVAAAGLGESLGVAKRPLTAALICVVAVQRFFPELALTAGNDLVCSFFFLCAVLAALRLGRERSLSNAFLLGLSIGLLVGTKYVGLIVSLALLPIVSWSLFGGTRVTGEAASATSALPRRRSRATLAVYTVLVAIVAGGYSYLRNAWATGNPLYPQPISLLGLRLFDGAASASLFVRGQGEEALAAWGLLWSRRDLWGPLGSWSFVTAALLAPALALWRWRRPSGGAWPELAVFAIPTLVFAEFAFLMQDHSDLRYFASAIFVAGAGVAWCLDRFPARWEPIASYGLAALGLAALSVRQTQPLVVLAGATLLWMAHRLSSRLSPRWRTVGGGVACALLLVCGLVAAGPSVARYSAARFTSADQPTLAAIEQATAGQPAVVAYLGDGMMYPYFGRSLQNRLETVPTRGLLENRFYDWGGVPSHPFGGDDGASWCRNALTLGVNYVVLERVHGYRRLRGWMEDRPAIFSPAGTTGDTELWQVASGGDCGAPPAPQ
jgi:hypothetical protein